MSNKRFLKKLLATTAVVGTLAAGAMEAQAANDITTGDGTYSTGNNIRDTVHNPLGAPVTSGDTVFLGGAHDLVVDPGVNGFRAVINVYGNGGQGATLSGGTLAAPNIIQILNDISPAAQVAAQAAATVPVAPGVAGGLLNLVFGGVTPVWQINDAGTFAQLGLTDFNNVANSVLNINASGTITSSFESHGGGAGTVAVLAGKSVVFKSAVANMFNNNGNGAAITTLTGGAGSTITVDSTTVAQDLAGTAITFGAAGAARTLNLVAQGHALTTDAISGNVNITVTGDNAFVAANMGVGDAIISLTDTANRGVGATRRYVDINASGPVLIGQKIAAGGDITVGNITGASEVTLMNNGGRLTFGSITGATGPVVIDGSALGVGNLAPVANVDIISTGSVTFKHGGSANIGAGALRTFTGASVSVTGATTAQTLTINAVNSTAGDVTIAGGPTVGAAAPVTITSNVAAVNAGNATLNLVGGANVGSFVTVTGNASSDNTININAATAPVTVTGTTNAGTIVNASNTTQLITLTDATTTPTLNIGGGAVAPSLPGGAPGSGGVIAKSVGGNIGAVAFTDAGGTGVLYLQDGNIGAVTSAAPTGAGVTSLLSYVNNSTVSANVGSAANALGAIVVGGVGATTLTVQNNIGIYANNVVFGTAKGTPAAAIAGTNAATTIILGNNSTIGGNVITAVDGTGIIKLANSGGGKAPVTATVTGSIGKGATNFAINGINLSDAGGGSVLNVGSGVNGDVNIALSTLTFNATTGQNGAINITGGTNHNVFLNAAVTNQKQGILISSTTQSLNIITAGHFIGAAGDNFNTINALNASKVVFESTVADGNVYLSNLNVGSGTTVVVGDANGAHNFLFANVNAANQKASGPNFATPASANTVKFLSGTNLGNFGTFTIGANPRAAPALEFDAGVNVAGTGIYSTNDTQGVVQFDGQNKVTATLGKAGNSLNQVIVNGANVTLSQVFAMNGVNIAAGGSVNVTGSITGPTATAGITSAANGLAVNFTNTTPITVSGDLGATGGFAGNAVAVTVGTAGAAASTVTIAGAAQANVAGITFNNNSTLALVGTATALNALLAAGNGKMIVSSTNTPQGILSLSSNVTVAGGDFGTQANPISALNLVASNLTFTSQGVNVWTNLTATAGQTPTAVIDGNAGNAITVQNIGTAANPYGKVTLGQVTGAATVINAGTIYGNNITFGSTDGTGATLVTNGIGGTLNLSAAPAALGKGIAGDIVTVNDNGFLGAVTTNAKVASGTINFVGNGSIDGNIGAGVNGGSNGIAAVNLQGAAGTMVVLNASNIYAPVNQGVTTLVVNQNATLQSYNANGATIDLDNNILTVSGATIMTGATTIDGSLNYDPTNGVTGGTLVFNTLDVSAVGTAITADFQPAFNVNTTVGLPADGATWNVITVRTPGTKNGVNNSSNLGSILSTAPVTSGNRFVTLTFNGVKIINGQQVASYTTNRNVAQLVTDTKAFTRNADAVALAGMFAAQQLTINGDQAFELMTNMGNETSQKATETLRKIVATNEAPLVVTDAGVSMSNATGARLNTVTSGVIPVAAGEGAAAGDDSTTMGAWVSAFGAQGSQGARKGIAGFKSRTFGGVIGFDTALNDQLIVGVAGGIANTKTKFKNSKDGDTVKANTYLFSIYSAYDFGNNWIVQGSGLFGNGSVKSSARRVASNTTYETATGKFDTVVGGVEVLGGYKFQVSDVSTVTPLAGLGYMKSSENAYKERGTSFQNLNIGDRTKEKLEGILGLRATTSVDMDGTIISPEFHGFVNYDFKAKAPKVAVTLSGLNGNIPTAVAKPARLSYNLGAGVMAQTDMVEYGVTYDSQISDKYFGHQGTLKLRVNF